jgi:hypothetical protein
MGNTDTTALQSNATVSVTTRHAHRCGVNFKPLLSLLVCLAHCVVSETNALAQQPAHTEELISTGSPDQSMAPTQINSPPPKPRRFAFTFNPLNLVIGRYGFNFEYQPAAHHSLVVTPHYDHAVADTMGEARITDHLDGAGAEIGYRYYTGTRGFEGFFIGPSLLLATHKIYTTSIYPFEQDNLGTKSFSSLGWAVDVGGQWQLGPWIIGAGVGMQYTRLSTHFSELGFPVYAVVTDGWWPRAALILGYAF